MQTINTQLRVTLPLQLQGYLQTKANRYGLSLSSYVKNLIINDVKDVEYPEFEMSDQALQDLEAAKQDEQAGALTATKDVTAFLTNL